MDEHCEQIALSFYLSIHGGTLRADLGFRVSVSRVASGFGVSVLGLALSVWGLLFIPRLLNVQTRNPQL